MDFQTRTFTAVCTLLCATALILIPSCKKKGKDVFYIKGQLIDSCGGNPVSGEKLTISFFNKGDWYAASKFNDSAGGGITDINGNFYIECNNEGDGKYSICDTKNKCVGIDLSKGKDQIVYMGSVYQRYKVVVSIKFNFVSATKPSDTLYYGYSSTPKQYFFPIPTSNAIFYNSVVSTGSSEPPVLREYTANWGLGIEGYQNARSKGTNQIFIKENVCVADTAFVTIP
jgi:hypothetical protein